MADRKNLLRTEKIGNWTMELWRRSFEAKNHTAGSANRSELNNDALTSEYYPSLKFMVIVHIEKTETHEARTAKQSYQTKALAEDFINRELETHFDK